MSAVVPTLPRLATMRKTVDRARGGARALSSDFCLPSSELRRLTGLVAGSQRLVARRARGHVRLDQLGANLLGRVADGLLVAGGGLLADGRQVLLDAVRDARLCGDLLLTRVDGLLDLRVRRVAAATARVCALVTAAR